MRIKLVVNTAISIVSVFNMLSIALGQCYYLKLTDTFKYQNAYLSGVAVNEDTAYFVGYINDPIHVSSFMVALNTSGFGVLGDEDMLWKREFSFASSDTSLVLVANTMLNGKILSAGYVKVDTTYGFIFQLNSISGDVIWRRVYFPRRTQTLKPIVPINMAVADNGLVYFAGLSGAGIIDQNGILRKLFITDPFIITNVKVVDTNRLIWSGIYMNGDTTDVFYVYTDSQLNVLNGHVIGTRGRDGIATLIPNDLSFRNTFVVEPAVFDTLTVLVTATNGIKIDSANSEVTLTVRVSENSGTIYSAYAFYGYPPLPTSFVPSNILQLGDYILIHGTVKLPDSNETEAALLTLKYSNFSNNSYLRVGIWHFSTAFPILFENTRGDLINAFFFYDKYYYGNHLTLANPFNTCDNCVSVTYLQILIGGRDVTDSLYIKPIPSPSIFGTQDTPIALNSSFWDSPLGGRFDGDCLIIDNTETPEASHLVYLTPEGILKVNKKIKELLIYDLAGRMVWTSKGNIQPFKPNLQRGIYIVNGITEDGVVIRQLLPVN